MTTTNIVPSADSLIESGEGFSCVIDSTGASEITVQATAGIVSDTLWSLTGGIHAGYEGSVTTLSGVTTITNLRRTAGWQDSPLSITVRTIIAGTTTSEGWSYYVRGIAIYTPGTKPYNEQFESHITVTENDVVVERDVNQFDFDSSFDVTRTEAGTVHIAGGGGGSGSDITVVDETQTLTLGVTKFTFAGAGVAATVPGAADEVVVTIPGGGGGSGGSGDGVVGTIDVSGGSAVPSANSVGINASLTSVDGLSQTVLVYFDTAFASTDYFVQATSGTTFAYFPVVQVKNANFVAIKTWSVNGTVVNPTTEVIHFDIIAQDDFVGGGVGDVVSSESSGTVQNAELAVFDGTTGKLIKGAGTGVYSGNGTIHGDTVHGASSVSTGGLIGISSPTATLDITEHSAGTPAGFVGTGRWWVRPETGTANTPMFTDGAGTEYDLTTGSASGTVDSVVAGTGIAVDATDTANPIVSSDDSAIVHDNLSGFVAAEHLDWSSDLGGTVIHANNYTSGSGITSWNGLSGAVTSIYVQAADPDLTITPNPGDIWIEIP